MAVFGYTQEQIEKHADAVQKAIPGSFDLQLYASAYVVIDGSLQLEEAKVDVRFGPDKTRVYVRWAVPAERFEFDGRKQIGREFRVAVLGPNRDTVVNRTMKLAWFAFGHSVNHAAAARAIFECARE